MNFNYLVCLTERLKKLVVSKEGIIKGESPKRKEMEEMK